MLLLITGSADGTADRIVHNLQLPVFRLNLDLIQEYEICITPFNWSIKNPTGLSISSDNASRVFWWKAFSYGLDLDDFLREETKYVLNELYSWFGYRNSVIGNPPSLESRIGKMRQLEVASKFFNIGESHIRLRSVDGFDSRKKWVVKSLTSGLTVSNRAVFTQRVDPTNLDPKLLWYVQELLDATHDVTIMTFGNTFRCFERTRLNLIGLDWRAEQFNNPEEWIPMDIGNQFQQKLTGFCRDLGVEWGRLDFMKVRGELYFLEMNMNGQWVFLDPENEHKLLSEVVQYIESATPHSLINLRSQR